LRKAIVLGLFSDNANEHLVLFAEPVFLFQSGRKTLH
jgi:hypothetical protein